MIGYWHHYVVCPSVRLSVYSVCNTVLVAVRFAYGRAESGTSMFLAGKFLFVPSDTFAV